LLKKSTKVILAVAVLVGIQSAAIVLWDRLPGDNLVDILQTLAEAIGFWLATSIAAFLIFWLFYNAAYAVVRWIWERFYRSPTL
jgi:hypothetical protein